MQVLEFDPSCPECSKKLVDAVDELVCPSCGLTSQKEVFQTRSGMGLSPGVGSRQSLGSYMGSREVTREERNTRGITGTGSNYEYLKTVSDFAGRSEGTAAACTRMIERIGEKLCLPKVARLEASSIAKKVLATEHPHRRFTVAAVSAYSLIAACKVEGVTAVSVGEVIEAHAAMGKRVTSSSVIQLTLESPVKTFARSPEDYLSRVLARLSMNPRLEMRLERDGVPPTAYFNSLRETAGELLHSLDPGTTAGRRPIALAESAVYSSELVLSRCESRRKRLTQRDLAACGDTAEYTIREQCARIFAPVADAVVMRRLRCLPPPLTR